MALSNHEKAEETCVRRLLARMGYGLKRCRRRDPNTVGYGLYRIIDARGHPVGGEGYRHTLAQAEAWAMRRFPRVYVDYYPGTAEITTGDARSVLRQLPDASVQCVVTSPPYWSVRTYGAMRGEIGRENTIGQHVGNNVAVFHEIKRVIKPDGVMFVLLGDVYNTRGKTRDDARQPSLNQTDDES